MDDAALLFDASGALVTADIDLIMDDELPGGEDDAFSATVEAGAHSSWQDDAARILFACTDVNADIGSTTKPRSSSMSTVSTGNSSGSSDDESDEWRPASFVVTRSSRGIRQLVPRRVVPIAAPRAPVKFEPSHEPCSGEIPYSDLVFWLGDASTGEVECPCAACARGCRRGGLRGGWRFSPYERISSKIPVVSIPRIEGWN
ncbi:hypothetical protein PybrP1_006321 [[Pythium] brassicae (nom. inval.)]|nr:hypothetical protein PybrP1_006321 [[Pythium] brassicae (nom. inval.)]